MQGERVADAPVGTVWGFRLNRYGPNTDYLHKIGDNLFQYSKDELEPGVFPNGHWVEGKFSLGKDTTTPEGWERIKTIQPINEEELWV